MKVVKRSIAEHFSCKAITGVPERVSVATLASDIAGLLRPGRPFPPRAILNEVFQRGRARAVHLGSRARSLTWRKFMVTEHEYEELRLECLTDPRLGLIEAAPPPEVVTFAQWWALTAPLGRWGRVVNVVGADDHEISAVRIDDDRAGGFVLSIVDRRGTAEHRLETEDDVEEVLRGLVVEWEST